MEFREINLKFKVQRFILSQVKLIEKNLYEIIFYLCHPPSLLKLALPSSITLTLYSNSITALIALSKYPDFRNKSPKVKHMFENRSNLFS